MPEEPQEWAEIFALAETVPVPAEILAVQEYARRLDCDYVLFDSDAGRVPDLPAWDW